MGLSRCRSDDDDRPRRACPRCVAFWSYLVGLDRGSRLPYKFATRRVWHERGGGSREKRAVKRFPSQLRATCHTPKSWCRSGFSPCHPSMLTRTRFHSFLVKGVLTRAVQFAGRSTRQGDNKALIASVPRALDHRVPHRHSCARIGNGVANLLPNSLGSDDSRGADASGRPGVARLGRRTRRYPERSRKSPGLSRGHGSSSTVMSGKFANWLSLVRNTSQQNSIAVARWRASASP